MFFKEFIIRPATNKDILSIKNIVFNTLTEYGLNPQLHGKDSDLDDIERNYFATNGYFGVTVNIRANISVGTFGLFTLNTDICELRKMYLLKEMRGRGLGKFILNTAIKTAEEKHFKKIILETISPLTVAIALYKQYGFKEVKPKEINERVDRAFELDL